MRRVPAIKKRLVDAQRRCRGAGRERFKANVQTDALFALGRGSDVVGGASLKALQLSAIALSRCSHPGSIILRGETPRTRRQRKKPHVERKEDEIL
jgi:hypothetical protein